ncbi:MAG: TIGR03987 family protein [Spirochaetes bacterium]|nr:MAG: TIGR03987 family protein [Spirochaetota bacterium]
MLLFAIIAMISALTGIISGIFKADIHGITGLLAIILMLVHALWATVVLVRKQENMIIKFHKFSIIVWLIWLIPFGTGVVLNAF